ncbi:MAG TPA: hypothetical protein VGS41_06230, partial [Chthonomonadales bacterium]|nr:hypothetical protein [Chthonomonadales bacterium]
MKLKSRRSQRRREAVEVADLQRRLLTYLRPHRAVLAAGLVCAAITAAITAGIAEFIKRAIDAIVQGNV